MAARPRSVNPPLERTVPAGKLSVRREPRVCRLGPAFRYGARGARMYETKTDTSALAWSPTGWPGVSMKMLQQVESTGGMIGMMRMEAGSSIPAHSHTHADQAVFVIEGDLVEEG